MTSRANPARPRCEIGCSAALPPSLKLRRTAVASAEAGHGCPPADCRPEGLRYDRPRPISQRALGVVALLCWQIVVISPLVRPLGAQAAREYRVVGMVLRVDGAQKRVVVSHESIPNFMEGMTMSFAVRDSKDLDGLAPGAIVEFTLVVTADASYAKSFEVRRYESVEQDPFNASRLGLLRRLNDGSPSVPPVKVGQVVPDFTLTNQVNQKISLSKFRGKIVALTFVYTSCPLPQFCLRTANNLDVLQRRFSGELGRDLMLLTVTFDPLRDRPEVLAQYASQWKADPRTWSFLTGDASDVRRVCQLFGLDFFPNEGSFDHSLRTVVIDRRGTLVANVEGNQFTSRQLGDLVQTALSAGQTR
jgi:protein SCO1